MITKNGVNKNEKSYQNLYRNPEGWSSCTSAKRVDVDDPLCEVVVSAMTSIYVLQLETGKQSPVVLGVYTDYTKMVEAKIEFVKTQGDMDSFFYEIKYLNGLAARTNEQLR